MPLWARFLCSASFGGAAALAALVLAAWWRLGYAGFWADLWHHAATVRFWELTGHIWAVSAAGFVLARLVRAAAGWGVLAAGVAGGTLPALAFSAYTAGRYDLALRTVLAEAALMAAGCAAATALAAWVHERL